MAHTATLMPHPNDDLLLGLKDGVLFSGDRSLVERHVATCLQCQARLTALTEYVASREQAKRPGMSPVARAVARRAIAVLALFGLVGGAGTLSRRELARRAAEPVALPAPPDGVVAQPQPTALGALPAPEEPESPLDASGTTTAASEASAPVTPASPGSAASSPAAAASPVTASAPGVVAPPVDAIVVTSPDRNFRWRVVGKSVERTRNGGTDWAKQTIEPAVPPTAGMAPSAAVCWLVGKAGNVWLGTGTDWKAVPLGELIDLVKIVAVDGTTAIVTSTDGREYSTTNAGMSWSLLPR